MCAQEAPACEEMATEAPKSSGVIVGQIIGAVVLTLLAGLFSGLTLGLMSLETLVSASAFLTRVLLLLRCLLRNTLLWRVDEQKMLIIFVKNHFNLF